MCIAKLQARAQVQRDVGAERVEVSRLTNKIYQDNVDSLEQLRRAVNQLAGTAQITAYYCTCPSIRFVHQNSHHAAAFKQRSIPSITNLSA